MKKIYLLVLGLLSLGFGALTQGGCPGKSNSPSAPVTVYVLVTATFTPTATPEPPVINAIVPQTVSASGPPLQITLGATDPYLNTVVFSMLSPPAHGTAGIVGNTLTYTPNASYLGVETLTFKCTDTVTEAFASEGVTITVDP